MTIIKLQKRSSGFEGRSTVFQMSVPSWVARKLGWKKGNLLDVGTTPSGIMRVKKVAKGTGE